MALSRTTPSFRAFNNPAAVHQTGFRIGKETMRRIVSCPDFVVAETMDVLRQRHPGRSRAVLTHPLLQAAQGRRRTVSRRGASPLAALAAASLRRTRPQSRANTRSKQLELPRARSRSLQLDDRDRARGCRPRGHEHGRHAAMPLRFRHLRPGFGQCQRAAVDWSELLEGVAHARNP